MKTLYIFRHGKSSWKDPNLMDFERPLNKRGQRDVPEMGRRLGKLKIKPDLIISSPAKRAITTARIIAEKIEYPQDKIGEVEGIYHGDEKDILDILKRQDNVHQAIMLFGHNPALTRMANSLVQLQTENIPTAGVVGIQLNTNSWQDLNFDSPKENQILFFDYPKSKEK